MKKFLVIGFMVFSFGVSKAQISDVQRKGQYLFVYGEKNTELSRLFVQNTDEYIGTGSSFYLVRKGQYICSYDYNSKEIARLFMQNTDIFKSAGGNTFNIKKGQYIHTYDKSCKEISRRME